MYKRQGKEDPQEGEASGGATVSPLTPTLGSVPAADEDDTMVPVPLVGRIAAGGPITAEQSVEEVYSLPRQFVGLSLIHI